MFSHSNCRALQPVDKPSRNWAGTAFRAAVGLGLAAFLVDLTLRSTGTVLTDVLSRANPNLLAMALLLYGATVGVTAFRWQLLLGVQGVRLTFVQVMRLTMIGVFFNLAIPGAVGGDLVKMAYVAARAPDRGTECVLTVMLDRVLGVVGLFLVAGGMVLGSMPFLRALGPHDRPLQLAAVVVGLGSVGGAAAAVLVELRPWLLKHAWLGVVLAWCDRRLPRSVVRTVVRLDAALELYRSRRRVLLAGLALSLAVHSMLALNLAVIGAAIDCPQLTTANYFLSAQVANAVASVPVTPAGIGTRDYTLTRFFTAMGADPSAAGAIPVLFSLVILVWSLAGAAVFVVTRRRSD